ncbi:hypothetical protein HYW17_03925 [Candidatus Uhrbacteria bacterium]|nr:hypothetical protein [Candidatus Uhrbacteria bacterium]
MQKTITTRLVTSMKDAREKLSGLTSTEQKSLEKSWDIEHAYYSSALEGIKLDRKEFEKLGKKIE